ncbi:MAG: MSMEG_4193 family putative phosphomutase [Anaerolineales bacterium]|nr:MSMEG_4193 family putative phosphomutase [Anaerolineales bacterium]
MDSTTFVLLVRHGENDYVTTHRLAGRTPAVHLNEKGRAQAAQLVAYLDQQPIRAVYSSPIERCLETASPLAAALELPVLEDAGLLEVDYGDWQGADLRELSKLDAWQRVQHYPSLFRFPAGETLREVQARAVSAVERIRDHHPNEVVAVFSHGDVIRTTLAHYLGVPLDLFQRIAISTAAVSVLAFMDGRPLVLGVNFTAALPKFEIKKPEPETNQSDGEGAQAATV